MDETFIVFSTVTIMWKTCYSFFSNKLHQEDVYEIEAYHHWCLMTVIVKEDQINTLACSP